MRDSRPIGIAHRQGAAQIWPMPIRIAKSSDLAAWLALRAQLWPDTPEAEHLAEAAGVLAGAPGESVAYLDAAEGGELRAFAEAALRRDHVPGCDTTPVAFLDGIFVRPEDRGRGIGRGLLHAVRDWARAQGCSELASDAHLDNLESHAFHRASGFAETARVVFFRRRL